MAAILDLQLDLPLADTPASRFLAWLAAGLVGLAALAMALAAMADGAARRIVQAPVTMTVALPSRVDRPWTDLDLGRIAQTLERQAGVTQIRVLAAQEVGRLVQPWLGGDAIVASLPLPRLIDVTFEPGLRPEPARLVAALASLAPGATADPGTAPLPPADQVARAVRDLALGAMVAAFLALGGIVAAVTRMSLDLHQATVDLLRLMGASDAYVGRQFEQHALASGLRGGLAGFAVAILVLGMAIAALRLWPVPGLPVVAPGLRDWLFLACLPVAGALLTAFVARHTARWGLRRLR